MCSCMGEVGVMVMEHGERSTCRKGGWIGDSQRTGYGTKQGRGGVMRWHTLLPELGAARGGLVAGRVFGPPRQVAGLLYIAPRSEARV